MFAIRIMKTTDYEQTKLYKKQHKINSSPFYQKKVFQTLSFHSSFEKENHPILTVTCSTANAGHEPMQLG